jgi:hypothetical protein
VRQIFRDDRSSPPAHLQPWPSTRLFALVNLRYNDWDSAPGPVLAAGSKHARFLLLFAAALSALAICFIVSQRHERFLALAFVESYGTLDWLQNQAAGNYNVRELGTFDGVKVLEFAPRGGRPDPSS